MHSAFTEKFPIDKLIPYERNPRRISQKAVDKTDTISYTYVNKPNDIGKGIAMNNSNRFFSRLLNAAFPHTYAMSSFGNLKNRRFL
jgi:hypothetical protein